ncbi:MAG: FAD-dependent oxidoreductase, partial [Actinobacteria bacterium]|nr:FAD-dependent oxidoreductase [Actinomycetota bacterium]
MPRSTRTVPGPTDSVVIVGAGLGGLSAALRLAGAGRQVTVLERAAGPGGRAGRLELGGYSFDTGPTVLTMPELLDDALACVGEKLADRLELLPLEPAYRANFADGSRIDVHTDPDRMADEIGRVASARDAAGYRRLVGFLRTLYRVERDSFIDRNLDSPLDLLGSAGIRLVALGGLRRLSTKIGQYLLDERLRRIFSFQAMYAGLAPQDALAIYAVISYMDTVAGVY